MKIAFAVEDKRGLDSLLSAHFGRCPYYILVEVDEGKKIVKIEEKDNPFYSSHQPGQIPSFIKEIGAEVIISGGMGPRAVDFFLKLGIKPITAEIKSIQSLLSDYLSGDLSGWHNCNKSDSCH